MPKSSVGCVQAVSAFLKGVLVWSHILQGEYTKVEVGQVYRQFEILCRAYWVHGIYLQTDGAMVWWLGVCYWCPRPAFCISDFLTATRVLWCFNISASFVYLPVEKIKFFDPKAVMSVSYGLQERYANLNCKLVQLFCVGLSGWGIHNFIKT